jgi:hypothetical protein
MVSKKVDTVVSLSAAERRKRIDAFKAKVSALQATSKVYHFDSDASFDTLDSLTTVGSSYDAAAAAKTLAPLPESPQSEKRDNIEDERKNLLMDSEDESSEPSARVQRWPAPNEISNGINPFMDSPDGSEDESIIINEVEEIVDPLGRVHKHVPNLLTEKKADLDGNESRDISAFKKKVASIRALSKEYHFRSDISLSTLDSVSTGVNSKDNNALIRIKNMLDRGRDVLAAGDQSFNEKKIDSLEDESEKSFVDSEDGSSLGLSAATNPFVDAEDEVSTDKVPPASKPYLESENKANAERMPTPPKPASNILAKKIETLNKATTVHSEQSVSVDQEKPETSIKTSSIKLSKQSVANSSSYSGSSSSGFSIDTIDEIEVTANDQPSPEKKSESVKSIFPFAQLLAAHQANKVAERLNESVCSSSGGDGKKENAAKNEVGYGDDNSFDDAVFNMIQKTLFQIDSVSNEAETDTEEIIEEEEPLTDNIKDKFIAPCISKVSQTTRRDSASNKIDGSMKAVTKSQEHATVLHEEMSVVSDEETSATDDSETTQACSNSNKFDYLATKDRETTLTPPKKDVVICDGSISTKNSIFGKVINVTNHDLVAERIYYESLRAQYHAELKVHVADEEIRLALDARMKAIEDFYKKKSTVVQIQECYDKEYVNKIASIPKVKPTVIREMNDETNKPPLPPTPSSSQRQETHKFALKRAHEGIDAAIKSANLIDNIVQTQEPTSDVPETIFTNDSFWNEGVEEPHTQEELEALEESLYKNHSKTAVNAWYFYRDVNDLLFESRRYNYEFHILQKDPLYPYLNSLVGIADSGDDGCIEENKRIKQEKKKEYADMSPIRICHSLAKDADEAMPKLKEFCNDIGTKLGMTTFAIGPTKKASEALVKCTKKYGGDPLLVTDYCRVSMFTKDIATLLAVMEILLTKYKDKVRRIKLSNLRSDHASLTGGYRDCKVNIDVDGHICEIQLHLEQLWNIKEGKGYAHYKACKANDVDHCTTYDITRTLRGLDRKFLSELIKVGADATKKNHVDDLHAGNEESIRDYFALACIYLKKGSLDPAEKVLSRLVKLRSESLIFGRMHEETLIFMKKLHESVKRQHKFKDASLIQARIEKIEASKIDDDEPTLSEMCTDDQCGALEHICNVLLDPSSVEREKILKENEIVEKSRNLWLSLRKTYWSLH